MKSLQELYDEVIASEEMKTEFLECGKTEEGTAEFLKKYDCSASVDELKAFLNEKMTAETKELSEEELKQIAGGAKAVDALITVLAFAGCVTKSIDVIVSEEDCLEYYLT